MRTIFTTTVACFVLASTAQAATLDFVAAADNHERGVNDGYVLSMDGEDVTFSSSHFAYFDHGSAGLGVCKSVIDFSDGGTSNRCDSGSGDDNVTSEESVTIGFTGLRDLSGISFNEEGHNPFGTTVGSLMKTILFAFNGGGLARYTFDQLQSATFTDVTSATFAYDAGPFAVADDRGLTADPEQFYLSAALIAPVPLPTSMVLLAAGIGGLGFTARRKRRAS